MGENQEFSHCQVITCLTDIQKVNRKDIEKGILQNTQTDLKRSRKSIDRDVRRGMYSKNAREVTCICKHHVTQV